jgi:hypothetical protein
MFSTHGRTTIGRNQRSTLAGGRSGLMLLFVGLVIAMIVALLARTETPARAATTTVTPRIDLQVLLLGTSATQSDLVDWQAVLQREGVSYNTIITAAGHTPITSATLSGVASDGTPVGYYDGVIVADGGLEDCSSGTCTSTLAQSEWDAIEQYEQDFAVRQVTGDVYPGAQLSPGPVYGTGLNAPTFTGVLDGVSGALTSNGQKVFPYLKASAPITFGPINASSTGTTTWGSEATPVSTANLDTLVSGPGGSSLAGVYTHPDGVEELELTYASNQGLLQDQLLRHGVLAWVTRGVYFGDQRNYIEMDIDDTFTPDDVWDTATHQIDYSDADAGRMQPADVTNAATWEFENNFRMDQLFNMGGTDVYQADNGGSDPLLTAFKATCTSDCGPGGGAAGKSYADAFGWISHTYDTPYMDIGCATENYIEAELNQNTSEANADLGLSEVTESSATDLSTPLIEETDPSVSLGAEDGHVFVPGNHSGFADLDPGNPATVDPPDLDDDVGNPVADASSTLPAGTYEYTVTDQFDNVSTAGQSAAAISALIDVPTSDAYENEIDWESICHAADYVVFRGYNPAQNATTSSSGWTWTQLPSTDPTSYGTISTPFSATLPDNSTSDTTGGSTTNVAGGGETEQTYADTGIAGSAASEPSTSAENATELPWEQNPYFDPALKAAGITAVGDDGSKAYPVDPDTTGEFGIGVAYTGATYPADSTWSEPDSGAQVVPRHPLNIYYNAPTDQEELDEYQTLYNGTSVCGNTTCTWSDVINQVVTQMFGYMMGNDPRPSYVHQTNLMGTPPTGSEGANGFPPASYTPPATCVAEQPCTKGDGTLYQVLDPLLNEYNEYFNSTAPFGQLTEQEIADLLAAQSAWSTNTTVTGTIQGNQVTIDNTGAETRVPLTGVPSVGSAYAGSTSGWATAPTGTSTYTAATTWPTSRLMTLNLSPSSVVANGTATSVATVTLSDADGFAIVGEPPTLSATDSGVKIGAVTDNGNGTYTATITSSTTPGAVTITATDSAVAPDTVSAQATLTQTAGSATSVKVALAPSSVSANGSSTSTATATVTGASGNGVSRQKVAFRASDPKVKIGALTDNGNGTYTATLTSSTTAGLVTVTGTDNSASPSISGQATLTQTAALDLVAPVVGTGGGTLTDSGGTVPLTLSCPSSQSYCSGTVTITTVVGRTTETLAQSSFKLNGGTSSSLKLTLSTAVLKLLGRATSTRVTITATAVDAAGRGGTSSRSTTLYLTVDRIAPRVVIRAVRTHLSRGAVAISLGCPHSQSYCAGRLVLRTPASKRRPLTLGAHHFHIAGGHTATLMVALYHRALAVMRVSHAFGAHNSIRARIYVTAHDRAGRVAARRCVKTIRLGA